jgi:hypothetical protein
MTEPKEQDFVTGDAVQLVHGSTKVMSVEFVMGGTTMGASVGLFWLDDLGTPQRVRLPGTLLRRINTRA